jgi:hypothetical protein
LALGPGSRLGVYEVTAPIGEGGMGQVYRATDTTLGRQVAIKILPDAFAADLERLARFEREAKTLASLNHPHIAAIYGFEKSTGVHALVMELVEGDDLSQRIARGAIPLDEALPIAKQIAEALEAAHEQGIIHRDLKPANVKVRSDGTVKVLDFGLAKAMEPASGSSPSMSMSPTLTTPAMTQAGMILGTAAYMSPEQARGKTVDKRTDIWAFGAVLYEMLTGTRAFEGEDIADTLGNVMKVEPNWQRIPASMPPRVVQVMRACLQKNPKQRMDSAQDVRLALEGAFETTVPGTAARPPAAQRRPLWRRAAPVAAAIVASTMVGAAAWLLKPSPPVAVTRFPLALGEGQQFAVAANNQSLAVSPDGTRLVYVANNQLYLRSMSDLEARPIPGTQQTLSLFNPTFSPDSGSIAFSSQMDKALKKISVSGGAAVTICPLDAQAALGMSWDASGIVFGQNGKGIMRVSPNGGRPEVLVSAKEGEVMYGPQLLPGGEWVLFTLATAATADAWNKAQIVIQSLKSSERRPLVSGGSDGRYLPTGHLVYALEGVVFAVPFDLRRLAVTGGRVPVVEGVQRSTSGSTGVARFGVSSTGSLAYIPGPSSGSAQFGLALIDRRGGVTPLKLPPGLYEFPRMSPDGTKVAFCTDDGKDANVYTYDLSGKSGASRLTFGGRNRFPIWSSDGQRLAFQSDREGDRGIFWQRADGTGTAERLTKPEQGTAHVPESWSPTEERFLFGVNKRPNLSDPSGLGVGTVASAPYSLWTFSLQDRKATPFGQLRSYFPFNSVFSPNGRWVAYGSGDEKGVIEIYVQPFPATGAVYQVSKDLRSHHPLWSPDGKELSYIPGPTRSAVAVSIMTQPSFTSGNAVPMPFPVNAGPSVVRNHDMARDGRVIVVVPSGQTPSVTGAPAAPQIQVVLNWFEELKAKVPTK